MGSSSSAKVSSLNSKNLLHIVQEIKKGSPEVINIIKEYPNFKDLKISEVNYIKNSWTLLHLASWHGNVKLCIELIRLGIDTNKVDNVYII